MTKVQRYKVGYYTDEWGMSSNTPCLVPADSGYAVKFEDYCKLEAALKVARDGIDEFLVANDPTEFGCACDLSVGYLCGPCHADKQQQQLLESALAKINEVLK